MLSMRAAARASAFLPGHRPPEAVENGGQFMCVIMQFEALAKKSRRYFEKCAKRAQQFRAAKALFTEEASLRRPGPATTANFAAVTDSMLFMRTRHHCTWERRMRSFNTYRGRERAVARVARDIIGPRKPQVRHVTFFGKAEFGSGSRNPIPRKRFIRHLACLEPTVLTDELRSSSTCPKDRPSCAAATTWARGSSVV
ncbi:hypothetical protein JKP88DRAFT_247757 [Tribonema minus]|uniref:Uncharacterized protein n=1 Tax=Tribonema minus TaxID=303371 RepID=A0A835YPN9_9STRA|nr:hypothetical protein JKP88DRAFT_247757 [Tribonema minus]